MLVIAALCGAGALLAGGVAFTGIAKGLAAVAKVLFFGFLAVAGVCTALALFAAQKMGH